MAVNVNRHAGLVEAINNDDVSGFSANAFELEQFFYVVRNFASVIIEKDLADVFNSACFHAVEPDWINGIFYLFCC